MMITTGLNLDAKDLATLGSQSACTQKKNKTRNGRVFETLESNTLEKAAHSGGSSERWFNKPGVALVLERKKMRPRSRAIDLSSSTKHTHPVKSPGAQLCLDSLLSDA